jgi:hypothetical protein
LEKSASLLWAAYSDLYHGRPTQTCGLTKEEILQLALQRQHEEEQALLAKLAEHAAAQQPTNFHTPRRRIHPLVRLIVERRAMAQGGCEDCHRSKSLQLHHLHYRSVGFELPHDLVALCDASHVARHQADPMLCWR